MRCELINAAISKASALTDFDIHNDIHKIFEFRKKIILADGYLTNAEILEAIKLLNKSYDHDKVLNSEGTKRICENCKEECLATSYCELCIRNYLKANFPNWKSGNDNIDNLIRKCQMETLRPDKIVEWIPYNNLQNIRYKTRGGFSEIYTADWIDGGYDEWNSNEKQLKRKGSHKVILKRLESVESAKRSWFEEAKSHLTVSNKWNEIVGCFGLTQDPLDKSYMLVVYLMDMDLRSYLQLNHNKLTWKRRFEIINDIVNALSVIHSENAIHRDLHSGNILCYQHINFWNISDFGFCGPVDKPLDSVYGNLPYLAPEVITKKETTFASDIYSIGMLMWEISSGQPPFASFDHNYDLAMSIVYGMRPRIVPGTPLRYKILMERCWNATPTMRPHINSLSNEIYQILKSYNQNEDNDYKTNIYNSQLNNSLNPRSSFVNSNLSKIHSFRGLPEPRNATKEEQEAYYSIQNDLILPDSKYAMNNIC
ncbi:hypothetical protein RclHR1_17150002 [Rhizophagus clarus]|uniref:Kinase-like domain-containing protein n=1 Tax=Rhizophagus clarus TaxID=94130 RepID=A0A2Z6RCG6_9GLOM|nr:hypothetical protein RclHR1_17150002 [Rhizophagus clarus]GES78449.1 kinase-like domain-containing protein [Rhizophagus clarus]